MSVVRTQTRFNDPPSFQDHVQEEVTVCWRWCVKIYHQHSDLVTNLGLFAVNTTILVSKIFEEIPKMIPRGCYVALNFTGVFWLNIQFRDLIKNGEDLYQSIIDEDMEGIVFTAAKVTVKSLNILLTGSMLAAAVITLVGFPEIALSMYAIMQPFAIFSVLVGLGTDVYDHKKNSALASQFTQIETLDEKVKTVMDCFLKQLMDVKSSEKNTLAKHTFRQLDHYTVEQMKETIKKSHPNISGEELIKAIPEEKITKLFSAIKEAFLQKQKFMEANLGLMTLGYLSMGICRVWPGSVIQSSVTWGMSLLYTSKKVWEKYLQSEWQKQVL